MTVVDDAMTFKPEAIRALKAFKELKTFKPECTSEMRLSGMQTLIADLTTVYKGPDYPAPVVITEGLISPEGFSGLSDFRKGENGESDRIIMRGRLSIITLLHMFARCVREYGSWEAQKFAVNLFRKVYPRQWEKLTCLGFTALFRPPSESAHVIDEVVAVLNETEDARDFETLNVPSWAANAIPADSSVPVRDVDSEESTRYDWGDSNEM